MESFYKKALGDAMTYLGKKQNTRFIGQQIVYKGNPMSGTLENVDKSKMIETPVFEEVQMGMSLGMAATGLSVITFYPRWDFLISATNQLVNHVDKWKSMTGQDISLIIRVGKGADEPLDPGHQHKGNYFNEFSSMCKNIQFHDFIDEKNIYQSYVDAYKKGGVHLMLEYPQLY